MDFIYTNIPQRQYHELKSSIDEAVREVLNSPRWLNGEKVTLFSKNFAKYIGISFCLPVANGTDALEIALRSLNVEDGAGCITVANAGGYTSIACHIVGLEPQYIDVNSNTLLMDLDLLEQVIRPNTKVIVATHLYGNVVDINAIRKILSNISREDILIVEDCAQAHGARCNGERVGSLGDIATFSFYPTKNLGTMGDGGAIVTSSESLFQRAKYLHQYGWESRYKSTIPYGRNSRMDEIHAAILNVKLPHLDDWNEKRRQIIRAYREALPINVDIVTDYSDNAVCHLAVLKLENKEQRDTILNLMKKEGIFCDIHYPILDCDQKAWSKKNYIYPSLPVSQNAKNTILTLPCFPELRKNEIDKICTVFNTIYNSLSS